MTAGVQLAVDWFSKVVRASVHAWVCHVFGSDERLCEFFCTLFHTLEVSVFTSRFQSVQRKRMLKGENKVNLNHSDLNSQLEDLGISKYSVHLFFLQ